MLKFCVFRSAKPAPGLCYCTRLALIHPPRAAGFCRRIPLNMPFIRSFSRPLAGLFLLLCCIAAQAVTKTDIYTVTLPVPDQSAEARAAAVTEAFEQVLVKMTGQRDVAARPEAQALLASPGRYLAAFRYEQKTVTDPETNESRAQTLLQTRFDAQAMARAVREAGLPLWGDERPATLVWLALEDGRQRVLLSAGLADDAADEPASFGAEALSALQAAAEARGVPLILPLLDSQDRAQVAYADVAGGFVERVLAASERYGADAVLVGRVCVPARSGPAAGSCWKPGSRRASGKTATRLWIWPCKTASIRWLTPSRPGSRCKPWPAPAAVRRICG